MGADDRERWNRRHADAAVGGLDLTPAAWLAEHRALLEAQPRGRALDIACGTGRNAFLLAELGFAVDAVDVSDVALDLVESHAGERGLDVRAIRLDLEQDPLPGSAYEVVLDFDYLERSLFGPIAAALAPGGLLFFETFTRDSAMNPAYTLDRGEVLRAFGPESFEVLDHREGGERPVASLVARRLGA